MKSLELSVNRAVNKTTLEVQSELDAMLAKSRSLTRKTETILSQARSFPAKPARCIYIGHQIGFHDEATKEDIFYPITKIEYDEKLHQYRFHNKHKLPSRVYDTAFLVPYQQLPSKRYDPPVF